VAPHPLRRESPAALPKPDTPGAGSARSNPVLSSLPPGPRSYPILAPTRPSLLPDPRSLPRVGSQLPLAGTGRSRSPRRLRRTAATAVCKHAPRALALPHSLSTPCARGCAVLSRARRRGDFYSRRRRKEPRRLPGRREKCKGPGERAPPSTGQRHSLQPGAAGRLAEPAPPRIPRLPTAACSLSHKAPPRAARSPRPSRSPAPSHSPAPLATQRSCGGARVLLIPRLPAPAATLAPRSRRRATRVSLPRETPFALREIWLPCLQAGGRCPRPEDGRPLRQAAARWRAGGGGDTPVAGVQAEPGLPPRRKDAPRSGARPAGTERPSLTRLLSDLLISGGRLCRSPCHPR
jgi:hypothetical protein